VKASSTQEIYAETIISILTNQGRWAPVTAKVGQEGLGYYLANDGYVVTNLGTGFAIVRIGYLTFNALAARNEQFVQRFIERIVPLINWKGTQEEITAQAKEKYPGGIFYEFRLIFTELVAEDAQRVQQQQEVEEGAG
jgi:hypothetical protein